MKRYFDNFTALLFTFVLCLSLFIGCSEDVAEEKPDEMATENEETSLPGMLITEEPLELSIYMHYWDTYVFDDEWPTFVEAGKMTNIKLKGTASSISSNSNEAFNIMMASGDLADIVHVSNKTNFDVYGSEGAFVPLNDLIAKHAPNITKFFDENPDIKTFATSPDGNIYFIPHVNDGEAAMGWFIRTDWLETLGLEVPTNHEEYYDVLVAFRDQDPNGNGKKDEIPFFNRNKSGGVRELLPLFGLRTNKFYVDDMGVVKYGLYDERYENAMTNIAKWYDEGLIDPEIFTRGSKSRDILLGENIGGATRDWFGSTSSFNDKLAESIPNFAFMPMAPPADINGEVWEDSATSQIDKNMGMGWGISVKNEHQIETIKYFDFWFTEEGRRLGNYGIEGVHYNMVDGKPVITEAITSAEEAPNAVLWGIGSQINIGIKKDYNFPAQWMNPVARMGTSMYIENGYPLKPFPELSLSDEDNKTWQEKWPAIDTYMKETMQKWTLGAESVEENFDNYMETLKNMGIEELLEIQQKTYDAYIGK